MKRIFLAIVFALTCALSYSQTISDEQILVLLNQSAVTMNTTCPRMIDDITRLEFTKVYPPKTIDYNYTLLAPKSNFTDLQISEIKSKMEVSLIQNIRINSAMGILRDNNVTFIYTYKDMNGVSFFSVIIYPYQYK
ncbi:MAG: hypothetical protein WC979_03205 [Candidatus Pacearchaeota archaeon]|jgi:hypothetical protein|nr:hypothetical protein [Clostridia bacterium]